MKRHLPWSATVLMLVVSLRRRFRLIATAPAGTMDGQAVKARFYSSKKEHYLQMLLLLDKV